MSTTIDRDIDLATAIDEAKAGADLMVRCKAHDDGRPSLHVSQGKKGATLQCFAGCTTEAIIAAAGVPWGALFYDDTTTEGRNDNWTPRGEASHIYPYTDGAGTLLFEVMRVPQPGGKKDFLQRRPDHNAKGGYVYNLHDVRRVLYRLPEVLEAVDRGVTVYLPEGEKDVETLRRLGQVATCNAGGAKKWESQYSEALRGATVVIYADADDPGREHARMVREMLIAVDCAVEVREASNGLKDITEMVEAGFGINDMLITTPFEKAQRSKYGIDLLDVTLRKISDVEFVIPGTLARRERLVITGFEGMGKSNLLRYLAACVAAGIHPWTLKLCEPRKVVYADVENEPGQTLESWQLLQKLCDIHGAPIERGQLIVLEEWDNSDLDLSASEGSAWLHERVEAYRPDLMLMGPLTNLVGRDLKDDEPVRRLKGAVNDARTICGTAFVMEHHAPHQAPNAKRRSIRPYGSSMFLRWPDFGYGLLPTDLSGTFEWDKFRWPRVRTRVWPQYLKYGNTDIGEMPWVETMEPEGWKAK